MVATEEQQRRGRIQTFLTETETPRTLAERLVASNPWLCEQIGVDFAEWAKPVLRDHGLPGATLHLVGSAATGFSLRAEQAGRSFRKVGGIKRPSDLDLGIVDEKLFDSCWTKMIQWERGINCYLEVLDRAHVYWGRIDRGKLPERAYLRIALLDLQNAVTRSREFWGYPASLRVYRHRHDLIGYLEYSIQVLMRSVSK